MLPTKHSTTYLLVRFCLGWMKTPSHLNISIQLASAIPKPTLIILTLIRNEADPISSSLLLKILKFVCKKMGCIVIYYYTGSQVPIESV